MWQVYCTVCCCMCTASGSLFDSNRGFTWNFAFNEILIKVETSQLRTNLFFLLFWECMRMKHFFVVYFFIHTAWKIQTISATYYIFQFSMEMNEVSESKGIERWNVKKKIIKSMLIKIKLKESKKKLATWERERTPTHRAHDQTETKLAISIMRHQSKAYQKYRIHAVTGVIVLLGGVFSEIKKNSIKMN